MKRGAPELVSHIRRDVRFSSSLLGDPNRVPREMAKKYPLLAQDELGQRIAGARMDVARRNSAMFFTHLYQGLFGGRLDKEFSYPVKVVTGDIRQLRPDAVHRTRHAEEFFTEVKSYTNSWQSGTYVRVEQFENYAHEVLDNLEAALDDGSSDLGKIGFGYGYFRFKTPTKYKKTKRKGKNGEPVYKKTRLNGGLGSKSPVKTLDFLTENINDFLFIPSNLAMLISLVSEKRDQDYRGFGGSWRVMSGDISALLKGEEGGIERLLAGYDFDDSEGDVSDILRLDLLKAERLDLPAVKFGGKRVSDFKAVSYGFKDEGAATEWANYFFENHKFLLVDYLGVRDLYEESLNGSVVTEDNAEIYSSSGDEDISW